MPTVTTFSSRSDVPRTASTSATCSVQPATTPAASAIAGSGEVRARTGCLIDGCSTSDAVAIAARPAPLVSVTEQPAPLLRAGAANDRPSRVLVVDDERRIRLAIRNCLELEGYEVLEAGDGREAIAAILASMPDLVLLDLAMPNLDGLGTLRLLSTVHAGSMPPVLVLTAHGSITASEVAVNFGATGFIEKPVAPQTLRAAVESALNATRSPRTPAGALNGEPDAAPECN